METAATVLPALVPRASGNRVYTAHGFAPEVVATAMAAFSRSASPMDVTLAQVGADRARDFVEKFYVNYGHASIADMALLTIAMEQVTQLAAWELWDTSLVGGQEQSTRYQEFGGSDCYRLPAEIMLVGDELINRAHQLATYLLERYAFYLEQVRQFLQEHHPQPDGMSDKLYVNTIKARALDVARYWLFGGVLTSVGQVMSVRTFEVLVRQLLASPRLDIQQLARDMIEAAMTDLPLTPAGCELEQPVAAGLAKYLEPDRYLIAQRETAATLLDDIRWLPPNPQSYGEEGVVYHSLAQLMERHSQVEIQAVLLLYPHINYPLRALLTVIGESRARETVRRMLALRGAHDPLPLALAGDRGHFAEVTMDIGGMRDLHRHRNLIQLHQPRFEGHGFAVPDMIELMGLGDDWRREMNYALLECWFIRASCGHGADSLQPFGTLVRTLYCMDLRELVYLTELRSRPQGHPSYRRIAASLWEQCEAANPHLAGLVRVEPYQSDLTNDIFKR